MLKIMKIPPKVFSIKYLKQTELLEENRHVIEVIIKTIHLINMWKTIEAIALRGHKADYSNDLANKGNLLAMLSLIEENDEILRKHLFTSKNAKYTSKAIQNQIIQMIWDFTPDKFLHAIRENDSVFSLIADEVTDISDKEILSLCVRYVLLSPKIQIKEIFIDFVCHVLNLSIAASCKMPSIRNMVENVNEISLFFGNSPPRQRVIEAFIDQCAPSSKVKKLKSLCKTRWVERHLCFDTVYELLGLSVQH